MSDCVGAIGAEILPTPRGRVTIDMVISSTNSLTFSTNDAERTSGDARRSCALLAVALLAPSCATPGSDGYGIGVTFRGTLGIERFQGPVIARQGGSSSAAPQTVASADTASVQAAGVSSSHVDDESGAKVDVDRGFGAVVAWTTPYVDLTTGLQRRKFGSLDTTEGTVGLRRRLYVGDAVTPYVFFELRHTRHENRENQFFNGFALGLGTMFLVTQHWFVDANLAWERTSGLTFSDGESRWDEGVLQLGFGGAW